MKIENILEAEQEAKRFLKRLKELKDSESNGFKFKPKSKEDSDWRYRDTTYCSKETAALKRSSMDLSRSLSKMRNSLWN